MKIKGLLFLLFQLLIVTSINAQVTISVSPDPICVPYGGNMNITVTATVNPATPATGSYTYYWERNTSNNTTSGNTFTWNVQANYFPTQTFKVTVHNTNGNVLIGSASKDVNLYENPDAITENPPSTIIQKNTTDAPEPLNSMLQNFPSGTTFVFTGSGVELVPGSTVNYQFNPSLVSPGTYNDIKFTATKGSCSVNYNLSNTSFKVVDGLATLPGFIKNIDPMPICENSTSFLLNAAIDKACFPLSVIPPSVNIYIGYATGSTSAVGIFNGLDYYSGNPTYKFAIDPSRHYPSTSYLYVYVYTSCGKYFGYIPLTPKSNPYLSGLPNPTPITGNEINLCSASNDTIFMRGNPSGGTFHYYLGTLSGATQTYTRIYKDSISPYPAPIGDPSLVKFVPSDLYRTHGGSTITNEIKIVYNYALRGACPDSITRILKFLPTAPVSFVKPPPPSCFGDTILFSVSGNAPGDQFQWAFGDGFNAGYDTDTIKKHYYNAPGKYPVRFRSKLASLDPTLTCNNDMIDTVRIGALPTIAFDVYKNFLDTAAIFKSKAYINVANISNKVNDMDTIVTWFWDFGTSPSFTHLSTQKGDTTFTYNAIEKNPYSVTHTVTAKWGCQASLTRGIPVFLINVPDQTNPSTDDFDFADINSWYESGQFKNPDTLSSWKNQTPPTPPKKIITPYPSGGDAWITSENNDPDAGYYNNEKSWVESPVYDIRKLSLPMVSLNTWTNTDNLFDGASLQYAFCDSVAFGKEKWHTLGKKNTGLEWYNSNTVISKPGNDLNGWTGDTSTQWKLSAYILDEPLDSLNSSKSLIRFRVALGSNSDNTPGEKFDGFAFDNFFVGERNRKVLIEEFHDYVNKEVGQNIDSTFKDPQAVSIQYNVRSLRPDDEINNQNMAEPSARALLYGVGQGLPRGVIDGIIYDNTQPLKSWGIDDFYQRLLIVSPFDIHIGYKIDATRKLNIYDTIYKTSSVNIPGPFVTQIAIVEKKVVNSQGTFSHVLRNMIPSSAGTRIDQGFSWVPYASSSASWSPFVAPQSDLLAIVFIQDENTKEVYQTNYIIIDAATAAGLTVVPNRYSIDPSSPGVFSEVSLSPNPTSGDLNIIFNGILVGSYQWTMIDALGNHLKTGILEGGINAATINTNGLNSGMYYLQIEGPGQRIVKKFSLIK